MIIDSHCHLNMKEFEYDVDIVIQNALISGVEYMQTICTKLEDLPGILAITAKFPNVFASVGVHPHETDQTEGQQDLAEVLVNHAKHPKIIGIGETGLDYYYEHSNRQNQKHSFMAHIKASQETQLPIIIHTRDADEDTLDILKQTMNNRAFPGLLHCFSSSEELAFSALDLGLYISISGIVTFKNATALHDAVKKIPLEKLLVETDAPYLAPIPMRGKRNEPAFTRFVVEKIAEIKSISPTEVAEQTTKNFLSLFNKAKI